MSDHISFLRIPLYKLHYINNVDNFHGLSSEEISSLENEYTETELKQIAHSVEWATQNKDYDFSSLLPDINHSNDDIYKYLCKIDYSLAKLRV